MDVLFVDDDVDDREFFMDALSYVNPKLICVVAKDCKDALALLDQSEKLPSYIFLDINMPAMDGKGCIAQIKKDARLDSVKVVMYSTSSDEREMVEYKTLGATFFLVKPATFKELCDALAVMLDH
ncbi:MAG TPA: response regulator [Chryseosolibacter sp.]|nr:response regulator [Chryseosolibacter sp.]